MADDVINKLTVYKLSDSKLNSTPIPTYKLVAEDSWKIKNKKYPFHLYFHKRGPYEAPWLSVFNPLNLKLSVKDRPESVTSGFILLVQVETSVYGVTGGVGHSQLRKQFSIEHRFGIDLAQKILAIPELRGLSQKDTSGVVNSLDRVFRSTYNPRSDINNLKRVLTHVRGTLKKQNPLQEKIGRSIKASDALTVNGSKKFEDIIAFLIEVDRLIADGPQKITILQLEHISKKANQKLLSDLELVLVENLTHYDADKMHSLFLDNEDIGYLPDRVMSFELIYKRNKYQADDVVDIFQHVRDILSHITPVLDRREAFDHMRLRLHFDDGFTETSTFFHLLCGDIEYKNEVYFLNNRLWYKASDDFLRLIETELDNIECINPSFLDLEEWDKTKFVGEKEFNIAHKKLVIMDRRLVKIVEEKGGIEFCDLLSVSADNINLIHVKHDSGAALRALFAQGFVSAKLYAESDEFRSKIYAGDLIGSAGALTKKDMGILKSLSKRQRREMKVIFAVFDDKKSHTVASDEIRTSKILKGTLTTFAKVDLLERVSSMRAMGYTVALCRIKPYPQRKKPNKTNTK